MSDWTPAGTEPASGDPYASWDAAYVLGALSPSERRTYEEHLANCAACQQAVAQIAGLPGLLAHVTPDEAADLVTDGPEVSAAAPATLLPGLLERARRPRSTSPLLVGIAAALFLILGTLGVLAVSGTGPFGGRDEPYRVAFSPLQASPMVAVAEIVPQQDGTQISVECAYEDTASGHGGPYPRYEIWVTDRSGDEQMAKSWPVKTNKVMRPEAFSPWPESRIDHLEIRSAGGTKLLRADLD